MKISLVINTYNRMHTLPNTLRSLEYIRYPDFEVVVVDGPSTDGTLEYLEREWAGKLKICSCAEANLSKSRNVGIQNATGDIVCFTDDDGVPEPDWLDRLVVAYCDHRVAAAGGWVRNHTGVDYQTKYIVSSRWSTSEVLVNELDKVPECRAGAEYFPGLIGVNSSFRRNALLEVGGFDEEYAYFLDETDVLARMIDAGYRVVSVPDAEVHHKYAPSHIRSQNGIARSWLQIMNSTAYYIIKNAAPEVGLFRLMEKIVSIEKNLKTHTDWAKNQQLIDEEKHQALLLEIEEGSRKGVFDAFQFSKRNLIAPSLLTPWHDFPRLLPAENRLRLAFVTGLYPPRPCGGVAVFINHLAKQLAATGHEITVITQAESGRPHTVDFEEGVWVHRLPDAAIYKEHEIPLEMPDMPPSLARIANNVLAELDRVNARRRFNCVVGTIWDMDLAAVIASRKYSVAMYLVTNYKIMRDSKPEWIENANFYENHYKKMVAAERWGLLNANKIIASTHSILKDTEQAYSCSIPGERLVVQPFGVPDCSLEKAAGDARKSDDDVTLLYVGRFEHRKGADLMLAVLPKLLESYPSLKVRCVGDYGNMDGSDNVYVGKFLKINCNAGWLDRVAFLGHVTDETLNEEYRRCDIFVAPSRYESFGLIYLEAMRYGKPCIGSRAGGIPEVVRDGETGLLAEPGDPVQLQECIIKLIESRVLRETLGNQGRTVFVENYTTQVFAAGFERSIKNWLQSGNGGAY